MKPTASSVRSVRCANGGDSNSELHATQGLEGLDDRV
jgi:hypothetical protein